MTPRPRFKRAFARVKRRALRAFAWAFSPAGERIFCAVLLTIVLSCGLIEVAYNIALAIYRGVNGAGSY